jgi:hypothetical protein
MSPELLNHCFQTAINNREADFLVYNLNKTKTCKKETELYTFKKNFQVFKLRK